MSPTERFFAEELPRRLLTLPASRGTVAFSCGGRKWTVRLGSRDVIAGFFKGADAKLWFFADAFDRFLLGAALEKEDTLVKGDPIVLERFGRLLLPTSSSISVRFAA